MFESLNALPPDPILGLMALFKKDVNPNKVDLGVGVYRNEQGETPVLRAVREAEARVLARQTSKVYVGPAGNEGFNSAMLELLLGADNGVVADGRATLLQTPGGCGALRVAAELIKSIRPEATIWVSDPTWGNHIPLLGNCGLRIATYPYFNARTNGLDFEGMTAALEAVSAGDLVLLHACCHNPTGVDLSPEQWQTVAEIAVKRGFTPFVDMAYQGFGVDVDADAYGLRLLAQRVPEMLIAASCSKNFGLYRERVGAVGVIAQSAQKAAVVRTHLLALVRGIYSMPPDHGAAIVSEILHSNELTNIWLEELSQMRERIRTLRRQFSSTMREKLGSDRFDFVADQSGMFSFLGITSNEVSALAERFGIYMLQSSRASIAGLTHNSINYVCKGLAYTCSEAPDQKSE